MHTSILNGHLEHDVQNDMWLGLDLLEFNIIFRNISDKALQIYLKGCIWHLILYSLLMH